MSAQLNYHSAKALYEAVEQGLTEKEREEADMLATMLLMICPDSPNAGDIGVHIRRSNQIAEFLAAHASSFEIARQAHIDAYGPYATWMCDHPWLSDAWQKRPR